VGDQLISLDDWQVSTENLLNVYAQYANNAQVSLFILRHQRLKQLTLKINEAELDTLYLTISDQQKLKRWLPDNEQKL
jgi:hypothetical protein